MASLNQVSLIGNVGNDPKVTTMQNGNKVASFSLATTEKGYTTKTGSIVPDRTEWHNVVLWRQLAEIAEKYVRKGSQLFIQGKLRNRNYEDKQGQKRTVTEIEAETLQLLGSKPQNQSQPTQVSNAYSGAPVRGMYPASSFPSTPSGKIEEDLPF